MKLTAKYFRIMPKTYLLTKFNKIRYFYVLQITFPKKKKKNTDFLKKKKIIYNVYNTTAKNTVF